MSEWTKDQKDEIEAEWSRFGVARCPVDRNWLRCRKDGLYRGYGNEYIFTAHCTWCGKHFTEAHTHTRESA